MLYWKFLPATLSMVRNPSLSPHLYCNLLLEWQVLKYVPHKTLRMLFLVSFPWPSMTELGGKWSRRIVLDARACLFLLEYRRCIYIKWRSGSVVTKRRPDTFWQHVKYSLTHLQHVICWLSLLQIHIRVFFLSWWGLPHVVYINGDMTVSAVFMF